MRYVFASLLAVIPLAACAAGAVKGDAADKVSMARSSGALQCSGGGMTLEQVQRQLADAGVQVLSSSCGHDGRMRPMMCGRSDGSLHIVEVPAAQASAAASLKFVPLSQLTSAKRTPCS